MLQIEIIWICKLKQIKWLTSATKCIFFFYGFWDQRHQIRSKIEYVLVDVVHKRRLDWSSRVVYCTESPHHWCNFFYWDAQNMLHATPLFVTGWSSFSLLSLVGKLKISSIRISLQNNRTLRCTVHSSGAEKQESIKHFFAIASRYVCKSMSIQRVYYNNK